MKLVGIAAGLVILVHVFAGDRGVPALLQKRREAARLAADIAALRAGNAALTATIRALREDPAAIEAVARQTLGLARPDEIVVTARR